MNRRAHAAGRGLVTAEPRVLSVHDLHNHRKHHKLATMSDPLLLAEAHVTAVSAAAFVAGATAAVVTADTRGRVVLHNVSAYLSLTALLAGEFAACQTHSMPELRHTPCSKYWVKCMDCTASLRSIPPRHCLPRRSLPGGQEADRCSTQRQGSCMALGCCPRPNAGGVTFAG